MGMFFNSDINTLFVGGTQVSAVYMGDKQVWPVGLPVGTVFDFDYTGTVQSVELPKGKYKLQCWGAQGGTSYGSSSAVGSKGGYSEGVLTLTQKTLLYVFVGGAGSRGSSSSLVNGGWNGGGASTGYSAYTSGDETGYSYPACGGGATDISTVTSSMSYSSGRTNRSSASLLARCIVAGGGAGGSYRYTSVTTTSTYWEDVASSSSFSYDTWQSSSGLLCYLKGTVSFSGYAGYTARITITGGDGTHVVKYYFLNSSGAEISVGSESSSSGTWTVTVPSGTVSIRYDAQNTSYTNTFPNSVSIDVSVQESTSSTSNSSGYSNKSQQGGGTSGKGQYPGTQTSAGSGGGFGYGANQETTNYMYCSGGGGGGWYGGGSGRADGSTGYINYSGGGSGFVNTSANASSRPSGYTGLQLDSGTTTAGNASHPSTSGGTETGHSGNGYARITVVE